MSLSAHETEPKPIHATAISFENKGVLLTGSSGSGKSALAIELIARGALLIADDMVDIRSGPEGWPHLFGTSRMAGIIEARGLGLLRVPNVTHAPLAAIVEMDQRETARLPSPREKIVLGQSIPLLGCLDTAHFPAFLVCYLRGGRVTVSPDD